MNTTNTETRHVFTAAGLGAAPFTCVAVRDNAVNNGDGTMRPNGTCDFCGTGIRYECVIRSADGREFVVGCDCVAKTDDAGLRTAAARMSADAKLTPAARAANAARDERNAARAAAYTAERNAANVARCARADRWAAVAAALRPLATDLATHDYCDGRGPVFWANSFIGSVVAGLLNGDAEMNTDGTDRKTNIAREIYAKQFGRRNSKAFDAAADEFDRLCDAAAAG